MRDMNELHILAFDVLPSSTDDFLEVPDTHRFVSVQIYAAFGGDESKALFLRAVAGAELGAVHADFPLISVSYPIPICHMRLILQF